MGRQLLEILVLVVALATAALADDAAEYRAAFQEGKELAAKGNYPAAAKACERALELASPAFGPETENTATAMNNLAMLYDSMG